MLFILPEGFIANRQGLFCCFYDKSGLFHKDPVFRPGSEVIFKNDGWIGFRNGPDPAPRCQLFTMFQPERNEFPAI